jgi:hypothetical protein
MARRWRTIGVPALSFAVGVGVTIGVVVVSAEPSDPRPAATGSTPSPTTEPGPAQSPAPLLRIGGMPAPVPERSIDDPRLKPYPFTSPTPPPVPTELDGTYLRTLTLEDVGGPKIGLPYRCFRCPPYRVDAGVSTIVFFEGAFYVHHHLSGFRTRGSYVVDGDRITLFNDPNCPDETAVYEFDRTARGLRFRVVEDDCPFSGERAFDLMASRWTRIQACFRKIENLWPGAVAC